MVQQYPLEWLDTLISLTLNPSKIYFQDLTKEGIQNYSEKALLEAVSIQSELKNKVFSLHKESQIRLLVQKYHSALIILLDTLTDYQKDAAFQKSDCSNLARTLVSCLDELLFFIERRFANFLSLEERVPTTYLNVSRAELKLKLDKIKKGIIAEVADPNFTDIVLGNLYKFIEGKRDGQITFREVLYRKELVQKLERLHHSKNQTSLYNALNELLVYMNFNSRTYINYFTRSIADKINGLASKAERIDSLHFHYKEFRQMHCNLSMVLYPQHQNLGAILESWFVSEIAYLEKTLHLEVNPIKHYRRSNSDAFAVKDRVLLNFSSDQIALVLRACDETRLLSAKSLSEVFKTIVPHLSTPNKKELSFDAVRRKSYTVEENDKEMVVQALQKLIEKIHTF